MPENTAQANRLIHETSPYLLQHAHNPVDWRPWGEEAFAEARRRDVPIMLSSGYSACHWCHVMARESFADPETAGLINESFVPVKVDREERPDIDQVYQAAVQALTGQGGWPLTVFLTPEGEPFFGGTYFPPEQSYGRPGFREVLGAVARAWRDRSADLRAAAREIAEAVAADRPRQAGERGGIPPATLVAEAVERLIHSIDRRHGGFGRAPKFPSVPALMLMLRHGRQFGNSEAVDLALLSLRRMSRGGIHDQLGGGFHRYSTDESWLVPHFEKMLYDNAQLLAAYTAAYQITRDAEFAEAARGIVEYTAREMVSPAGGFYSTQDAESEGVEGKFFLWSIDEVREILADDLLYRTARAFYGLTEAGNFEGRNILRRDADIGAIAAAQGRTEAEVAADLERARRALLAARAERPRPFRDEKVILAWNGLMISGLAKAAQAMGERTALAMAARAAGFIQAEMTDGPGRLLHVWKDGRARIPAFLEDYAFFIAGLIDLYETDFDPAHLLAARQYQETVLAEFKEACGRYVENGVRGERLFAPVVSGFDQAVPSGAAVHAQNLIRLHCLTGEDRLWREAADLLAAYAPEMSAYPLGYAALLTALEMLRHRPAVVVIAGPEEDPDLMRRFREVFLPYAVVAAQRRGEDPSPPIRPRPSWRTGRQCTARTAFFVCSESACQPPATDWPGLRQALGV